MGEELQLKLLGNPEIRRGERILSFGSSKAQALLCYLAVTGRPHSRTALAGLLWGEMPETDAGNNLRKALTHLRQLVGPHLSIARQTVAFNRDNSYWLDVETLENAVRNAPAETDIDRLRQAVELYRGDFLEGFYVRQAPAFEEWILTEQTRLRELALRALHTLAAHYARLGDAGRAPAIDYTSRLLALEPWREESHRQMMLLLALAGQRGAALAQYRTCRQVLVQEFGVEPGAETNALYERIRDGDLSRGPAQPTGTPIEKERHNAQVESPLAPHPSSPPAFLSDSEREPVGSGMPVFVARQGELAQLDGYLDLALAGQGHVAFVIGGAGRGKTALLEQFARHAQQRCADLIVASGHCNAFSGIGDPYLPFREILELLTGDVEARWAAGSISRAHARSLWALLPHTAQALLNAGPDLIDIFLSSSALMSRATTAAPGDAGWVAQLEALLSRKAANLSAANLTQGDLFAQYSKVLQVLARQRPLLLLLDDLQWADAGSINLLFSLGRQLVGHRILIVGAYRSDEVAQGRAGERHPLEAVINEFQSHFGNTRIDLRQAEGRQFVESLLNTVPNRLSSGFKEALFHLTEGHALFTIEMLRAMQERGDLIQDGTGRWVESGTLAWKTLPPRVEGVIAERIARLPATHQEILKVASVEGEDFTAEIVAQVQAVDGRGLVRQLSGTLDKQHRLVTSQGGRRLETQILSRYRFRHILFQRYLYNSLDESERVYLHEAVGNTLERLYGNQADEVAVELARHFQMARLADKAVAYLQKAGEKAVRSYADYEAIRFFNEALALLKTLPDTPTQVSTELSLQIALGDVLLATKGFPAPEVEQAFNRARELCSKVGETPQLFPILHGLYRYYLLSAEIQAMRELGEQIMHLTRQQEDVSLLLPAELTLGQTSYVEGEFAAAQSHFDQGSACYDPERRQDHIALFGQDAMVTCQVQSTLALWHLGYPDQALKKSHEAVALAQKLSHPFSLAIALSYASWLHQSRREALPAQEWADASISICSGRGFAIWGQIATILRGWALTEKGEVERGIAEMRRGLADYQATGAEILVPHFLVLIAEAYGKAGQPDRALASLDEALGRVEKSGERNCEAELHRVKGELLLMQGEAAEAQVCFHQGLDVARRQGSKSLELRAAVSLSRLWQRQGEKAEARQMLTEIYDWFTEGFDTADLIEAKALLEELS
jgi:DNA-binding SARP family transcriptional activator/predicted ATPase